MFSKVPVLVCHFGKDEYVKNALRFPQKITKLFIGDSEENTKGIDNVDFIDVNFYAVGKNYSLQKLF